MVRQVDGLSGGGSDSDSSKAYLCPSPRYACLTKANPRFWLGERLCEESVSHVGLMINASEIRPEVLKPSLIHLSASRKSI